MDETCQSEGTVNFIFNGDKLIAKNGQSVAAAILENGVRILRRTRIHGEPRGIFCGIGVCFDCLVVVNGVPNQRACLVLAKEGLKVESQ